MKLIDFLRLYDPLSRIRVFDASVEDPVYEGSALDVPWYLAEYEVFKGLDGDCCAFSVWRTSEDDEDPALNVCVREFDEVE